MKVIIILVIIITVARSFERCQEDCRGRRDVTVDLGLCEFHNFTRSTPSEECVQLCDTKPHQIPQGASIYYKKGDHVIYVEPEVNMTSCAENFILEGGCSVCKTGWSGAFCNACAPGWKGDDCDTCAFGYELSNTCSSCIVDSLWEGDVAGDHIIMTLSFAGLDCTTVTSGTQVHVSGEGHTVDGGSIESLTGEIYISVSNVGLDIVGDMKEDRTTIVVKDPDETVLHRETGN